MRNFQILFVSYFKGSYQSPKFIWSCWNNLLKLYGKHARARWWCLTHFLIMCQFSVIAHIGFEWKDFEKSYFFLYNLILSKLIVYWVVIFNFYSSLPMHWANLSQTYIEYLIFWPTISDNEIENQYYTTMYLLQNFLTNVRKKALYTFPLRKISFQIKLMQIFSECTTHCTKKLQDSSTKLVQVPKRLQKSFCKNKKLILDRRKELRCTEVNWRARDARISLLSFSECR